MYKNNKIDPDKWDKIVQRMKDKEKRNSNMKAKLEFNLPEDEEQFNIATKAMDWALIVWDMDQQCRDWIKYDNHEFKTVEEALQGVRDMVYQIMEEKGVQLPNG